MKTISNYIYNEETKKCVISGYAIETNLASPYVRKYTDKNTNKEVSETLYRIVMAVPAFNIGEIVHNNDIHKYFNDLFVINVYNQYKGTELPIGKSHYDVYSSVKYIYAEEENIIVNEGSSRQEFYYLHVSTKVINFDKTKGMYVGLSINGKQLSKASVDEYAVKNKYTRPCSLIIKPMVKGSTAKQRLNKDKEPVLHVESSWIAINFFGERSSEMETPDITTSTESSCDDEIMSMFSQTTSVKSPAKQKVSDTEDDSCPF